MKFLQILYLVFYFLDAWRRYVTSQEFVTRKAQHCVGVLFAYRRSYHLFVSHLQGACKSQRKHDEPVPAPRGAPSSAVRFPPAQAYPAHANASPE